MDSDKTKRFRNKKNNTDYESTFYEPDITERDDEYDSKRDKPRKKKANKSQFALFYIITLITGVIICITVFAIVFSNISNKRNSVDNQPADFPKNTEQPIVENESETIKNISVITSIEPSNNKVRLTDVETNKSYTLSAEGSTEMRDKYGKDIAFSEFNIGDIVEATFKTKASTLESLNISSSGLSWEYRSTKGVVVNPEQNKIAIGNNIYTYDENLICVFKNSNYDITKVGAIDIVTVKGYKDKALFVDINKGHGYINIKDNPQIKDATVEIDTNTFTTLSQANSIEVLEGTHKVVVKGINIEPFIKEITINELETIYIDLNDIQFKSGVVNVKSNVTDYKIQINNTNYPIDQPIILDFGKYTLKVTKEGYLPFSQDITVDKPAINIEAELKEEVKMSTLTVSTQPEGAEVYIDNGLVGISPVTELVPLGKHLITVKKNGYINMSIQPELVKPKEEYLITLQLEPPNINEPLATQNPPIITPRPTPTATPDMSNNGNQQQDDLPTLPTQAPILE